MTASNDLPSGTAVFVDTNIFILADGTGAFADACRDLLDRVRHGDLRGYTSTMVLGELIHRTMIKEARERRTFPSAAAAVAYLQHYPNFVRTLSRHLHVASDLRRAGFDMLPLTVKDLHTSKAARRDYGLLANDSLIVAVMRNNRLNSLASNDAAFERVNGLQVWNP